MPPFLLFIFLALGLAFSAYKCSPGRFRIFLIVGSLLNVYCAIDIGTKRNSHPLSTMNAGSEQSPDFNKMKAYRVSQISDEDLRRVYKESEIEYAKEVERAAKLREEFWKQRAGNRSKHAEQCKDIAYRTKNENLCFQPLPLMAASIGEVNTSVEKIYESKIMGICLFVGTIKKAKELNCLEK